METESLCLTCIYKQNCIYNQGQKVLMCEEFSSIEKNRLYPVNADTGSLIMEPDSDINGICSNCNHRFDCTFRSPDIVIWRCEEYD
ncbi:MAG: hypothetical protein JXR31_03430 [Prolixibacteraceae bacterium]|nr:hypothetical protein [Prolixibacteraceae bacterium]MBN2773275.1 hypothetical protein [Prolixibacteraceae bacterium]